MSSSRGRPVALEGIGVADRKRQRLLDQQHQLHVHLGAGIDQHAVIDQIRVGHETGREQREARPGAVELEKAQVPEAPRRQVQVDHRLAEVRAAHRVDVDAREAGHGAVALGILVVDVVVAERAEEEVRERLRAVARRIAGRGAQPHRGVRDRQRRTEIERAGGLRKAAPHRAGRLLDAQAVDVREQPPVGALLGIHPAERGADELVVQLDLGREAAVVAGQRLDVLVKRQPFDVREAVDRRFERQRARRVVNQRLVVRHARLVALAAHQHRAHEVVERRAVVLEVRLPREVPVVREHVPALILGHVAGGGVEAGHIEILERERIREAAP